MQARWAWGEHGGRLYDAILIPHHKAIATACTDARVRVFSIETGELRVTSAAFGGWVNSLCVSRDGKRILATSRAGSASIWDWENQNELFFTPNTGKTLRAARFSANEKKVIIGGYDGVVSIWNIPRD